MKRKMVVGVKQPDRYKLEGISGIFAIWKDLGEGELKKKISAEYVKNLFEKITDEDCGYLDFQDYGVVQNG